MAYRRASGRKSGASRRAGGSRRSRSAAPRRGGNVVRIVVESPAPSSAGNPGVMPVIPSKARY